MVDITLCVNKKCLIREKCIRGDLSLASEYQSYAEFDCEDIDSVTLRCKSFLEETDD